MKRVIVFAVLLAGAGCAGPGAAELESASFPQRVEASLALLAERCGVTAAEFACDGDLCVVQYSAAPAGDRIASLFGSPDRVVEEVSMKLGASPESWPCGRASAMFVPDAHTAIGSSNGHQTCLVVVDPSGPELDADTTRAGLALCKDFPPGA